jgi:hypothetical protein
MLKALAPLIDPDGQRSDAIDYAQANYERLSGVTEHAVFDNIGEAFDTVERATSHFLGRDELGMASKGRIALATRGHDKHRQSHEAVSAQIEQVETPLQRDFMRAEHDAQGFTMLAQRWADVAGIVDQSLGPNKMHRENNTDLDEAEALWKGLSNAAVKRKLDGHYAVGGIDRVVKEAGWKTQVRSPSRAQDKYEMLDRSDVQLKARWDERSVEERSAAEATHKAELRARAERAAAAAERAAADAERRNQEELRTSEDAKKAKALGRLPQEMAEAKDIASEFGATRRSLHKAISSDRELAIDLELKGEMSAARRIELTAYRKAAIEHSANPLSPESLALNKEIFEKGILFEPSTRQALMAKTEIAQAKREREAALIEEGARNWMGDGRWSPEKHVAMNARAAHTHIVNTYKNDESGVGRSSVMRAVAMNLKMSEKADLAPEQSLAITKNLQGVLATRLSDADALKLDIAERATGMILDRQAATKETQAQGRS